MKYYHCLNSECRENIWEEYPMQVEVRECPVCKSTVSELLEGEGMVLMYPGVYGSPDAVVKIEIGKEGLCSKKSFLPPP